MNTTQKAGLHLEEKVDLEGLGKAALFFFLLYIMWLFCCCYCCNNKPQNTKY